MGADDELVDRLGQVAPAGLDDLLEASGSSGRPGPSARWSAPMRANVEHARGRRRRRPDAPRAVSRPQGGSDAPPSTARRLTRAAGREPRLDCLGTQPLLDRLIDLEDPVPKLAPATPLPTSPCPTADGKHVTLSRPARPASGRLLLPGRDHPGLHQAGVRLPRQPRLAAGRGIRRARHLAGQAGQAGEVPRATSTLTFPLLSRPGPDGARGIRGVGREDSSTARRSSA